MRCKKCNGSFLVEAPIDQPASRAPAAVEEAPATAVASTDLIIDLTNLQKTTLPRDLLISDTRIAVESKLRWVLLLSAIVITAGAIIRENRSGSWRIALLRIFIALALYLLIVLPFPSQSVKASLRKQRQKLPPHAAARIGATFAVPAALAIAAWQIYRRPIGVGAGTCAGLLLMFGVFCFQLRIPFVLALSSYVRASLWFLIGIAVSAGLVTGVNFVVNRALINAHAIAYHESPLGDQLAWQTPQPLSVIAPNTEVVKQPLTSKGDPQAMARPLPATPPGLFDLNDATSNTPSPAGVPAHPRGQLFVNPDDDQFLADLEKNTAPWIKQISQPSGQSPFDFLIVADESSSFIGFVSLDRSAASNRNFAVGAAIESRIRRAASFDITNDANPHAFTTEYLLTAEGNLLLHIDGIAMEMISTATHRRETFPLTVPANAPKYKLLPQLIGCARDHTVALRWSSAGASEQVVQRYSYSSRSLVETVEIHDTDLATEASAISTNTSGPIWVASIAKPIQQPLSICLINTSNARAGPSCAALPSTVRDLNTYEHAELAFSPEAASVALLLTDRSQAITFVWKSSNLTAKPLSIETAMLAPALASSHVVGPRIRWIDDQMLLVDGQSVISTVAGHEGFIGKLSETAALGTTTIAADHVLISYLGADGKCHLADIEFDAKALHDATPTR